MLRATVMTVIAAAIAAVSLGGNASASDGQPSAADRTVVADTPTASSNNEHIWG
ncbi:hypothetical protein [Streptomyces apocyni]|uniref:hypothetical protein n=1 Tax=Streptomyces apocyni TaxID=2654677 RepID=UPI0012EA5EB9|nr:hypothetical protein [Streptomyces apocyni]